MLRDTSVSWKERDEETENAKGKMGATLGRTFG